jgi:hypothetical protein
MSCPNNLGNGGLFFSCRISAFVSELLGLLVLLIIWFLNVRYEFVPRMILFSSTVALCTKVETITVLAFVTHTNYGEL